MVIVSEGGLVENRVLELPPGITPSMLTEASNFLSARVAGRTLDEARTQVTFEIQQQRAQIDELTKRVVEAGVATWSGSDGGHLIVRGRAHLLDDVSAVGDLERIRSLFDALETKQSLLRLIDATSIADGVQIFIGAENELFGLGGCSMIISPYANAKQQIVGAIGVIGPTRLNYARIIPMVDYTAKVITRLIA